MFSVSHGVFDKQGEHRVAGGYRNIVLGAGLHTDSGSTSSSEHISIVPSIVINLGSDLSSHRQLHSTHPSEFEDESNTIVG
jgi:hypothetical protein